MVRKRRTSLPCYCDVWFDCHIRKTGRIVTKGANFKGFLRIFPIVTFGAMAAIRDKKFEKTSPNVTKGANQTGANCPPIVTFGATVTVKKLVLS